MPIPIVVQPVKLPDGFSIDSKTEKGVMHFAFNPAVALPYDNASMEQYLEAARRTEKYAMAGPELRRDDLTALVVSVLRSTIPEFMGDDNFYQVSFNASGLYGVGMSDQGRLELTHTEGRKYMGQLELTVHSAGQFFPVRTEAGIERPTIGWGTIAGKVYLHASIPTPAGDSYDDDVRISAAMISSLALNSRLSLGDNQLVDDATVHIENPTVERMRAAITYVKEIEAYVAAHLAPMSEAAAIFAEAKCMADNYREPLVDLATKMGLTIARAKGELDLRIPLPQFDDTLAPIDHRIADRLEAATGKIEPLYRDFPRGILDYARPPRPPASAQ